MNFLYRLTSDHAILALVRSSTDTSTVSSESLPLLASSCQPHSLAARHTEARHSVRRFFATKTFHYLIIGLVSLDVTSIFCEFIVGLFACEGKIAKSNADTATLVLAIVGLVFSSAFLLELVASVWAFGLG